MSAIIGELIIDRVIAGKLMHATCAHDPEHGCAVVWSSGAVEQLNALVAEHSEWLVRKSAINAELADLVQANADYLESKRDEADRENANLRTLLDVAEGALKEIAAYDKDSRHGEGTCPYGCDTPHIADQALARIAAGRKET